LRRGESRIPGRSRIQTRRPHPDLWFCGQRRLGRPGRPWVAVFLWTGPRNGELRVGRVSVVDKGGTDGRGPRNGKQLQAEGGVTGWTTLPHSCTCTVITIFSFSHGSVPPTRCIPLSRATFLPNSDLSRQIPCTYLSGPPCMRSALPLERAMTHHMCDDSFS
jgi:hypothetical protein